MPSITNIATYQKSDLTEEILHCQTLPQLRNKNNDEDIGA
jgi:hypothetical protein